MCVCYRRKQKWFLEASSFAKASCLSYPPICTGPLLITPIRKGGRAEHRARLFAGIQEGRTQFRACSPHLHAGFLAGKNQGWRGPQFPHHGGLSFPITGGPAPPPGRRPEPAPAAETRPRCLRLPPPGYVLPAPPEARAGPRGGGGCGGGAEVGRTAPRPHPTPAPPPSRPGTAGGGAAPPPRPVLPALEVPGAACSGGGSPVRGSPRAARALDRSCRAPPGRTAPAVPGRPQEGLGQCVPAELAHP